MSRKIKLKKLVNTELAKNYGGWIYCGSCRQTIGYLCFETYHKIDLEYQCNCGKHGKLQIELEEHEDVYPSDKSLVNHKNRRCCPEDMSPLITLLKQKLKSSSCHIVCKNCHHEYHE